MLLHQQTEIFDDFDPATGGTTQDVTIGRVTYRIHTFTTSDTFSTGTTSLPVEFLLIGGGGGGGGGVFVPNTGAYCGGGGGAGGYVSLNTIASSSTNYTINVGGGGVGGVYLSTNPGNGGNTTAFGYTAIGGGSGGQRSYTPVGKSAGSGNDGGSGGGGMAGPGLGAISNQLSFFTYGSGNDGSNGSNTGPVTQFAVSWAGGYGGGAGNPGEAGGPGKVSNITGSNVTYARGGPNGVWSRSGSSDYSNGGNTLAGYGAGGGGGGATSSAAGGNNRVYGTDGASGVAIIRYPITVI